MIELKEISKTYSSGGRFFGKADKLTAVHEASLKISEFRTLGLVGESGCGKTTLSKIMTGLEKPDKGDIFFEGRKLSWDTRESRIYRKDIQMIFQDPYSSLNPRMTIGKIIGEPLKIWGYDKNSIKNRIAELLDMMGLSRNITGKYPHNLSGGMRQRVSIARALALSPKFIICDEPVSALDISVQAQILNLLNDLKDSQGLTYMFISHDLSVVRFISDDIAVMYKGRIVETGTTQNVFDNPCHPYTKTLIKNSLNLTR